MEPSDFGFIGPFKKHLRDNGFTADANVKQAVTSWLKTFGTDVFYARYRPWYHGGTNDYRWSGVYQLLHLCQVYVREGI
jgi:hypothetical protein